MTNDYNNGAWWGWNGGECPVHPESVVEAVTQNILSCKSKERLTGAADQWGWYANHPNSIIAFRVVKPYQPLREFWINRYPDSAIVRTSAAKAAEYRGTDCIETIHVREVRE